MEGPEAGLERSLAALEVAERRGVLDQGLSVKASSIGMLFDLGEWDRALAWAEEILGTGRDRLDPTLYVAARTMRSRIASLRGRADEADDAEALLSIARPVEELHVLAPALAVAAHLELEAGRVAEALAALRRFASVTSGVADEYRESQLAAVVRDCVRAGEPGLGRTLTEQSSGAVRRNELNVASATATMAEAGDATTEAAAAYAAAAEAWRGFGHCVEELEALRGLARCDPARATVAGAEADAIARRLGMPSR
jgi:hypothetical protein